MHLHNTMKNAINLLNQFAPKHKVDDAQLELIMSILSKDTLKSIQLLGFNYKQAIGEPLTDACASFINNKFNNKSTHCKKR